MSQPESQITVRVDFFHGWLAVLVPSTKHSIVFSHVESLDATLGSGLSPNCWYNPSSKWDNIQIHNLSALQSYLICFEFLNSSKGRIISITLTDTIRQVTVVVFLPIAVYAEITFRRFLS